MRENLDFSNLLSPSLEVRNKRGEIIFSMKRKGEKYGQLYYLFEWHWDRVDSEMLGKVSATWELIKAISRQMSIPLYDINDVTKKIEEEIKRVPLGTTKDISVPILNHATGKVNNLVVGIRREPLE